MTHQTHQQEHQQQTENQSSFSRKPPLRTNTSSSTTFSSITSMTTASSSVASPSGFSPSYDNTSFSSPPSHWSGHKEEDNHVFAPSVAYSPNNGGHAFQSHSHAPVIEPCVKQTSESLKPANLDGGAMSNSSSDTLSASQLPGITHNAERRDSQDENTGRTERSSSSSSSSSSLLSERQTNKEAYETPLTASLAQNEPQQRAPDAPGYPFPAVTQKTESKVPKHHNHDPWKHTDDLLAPSGKPCQQNSATQRQSGKGAASTLSLSKPSPSDSSAQQTSTSQTPTPTAAEMDRRDSQSSSVSSGSLNHLKSRSPMVGQGSIALPSSSASSGNLAKLSTSSSPATSSGVAGFSPLNAMVQPFSPSSNSAALPSKLSIATGSTLSDRTGRSQAAAPPQSASSASATHNTFAADVDPRRPGYRNERALEGSTTSSSGDTGYFSNVAQSATYAPDYRTGPPSAASAESNFGIDPYQGSYQAGPRDNSTSRQRSWSDNEAMTAPPTRAYPGASQHRGLPDFNAPWPPSHQGIQEHVDASFQSHGAPPGYGHTDPRYARSMAPYGASSSATSEAHFARPSSSTMPNGRNLHLAQGIDAYDASRYGYGPPSVSDVSTAGAEEISTIFVVGFPEDTQEREFQNMFLFARGFEAATLKIPASTAAARERDAAAAAAVSAIAATLPAFSVPPPPPALDPNQGYGSGLMSGGGSSYDHLNNSLYEETFLAASSVQGGPHSHVENAQRVSSALAAAALTATASTASLANTTNKKQIIGFAKFRSKDDALTARDVLSGRKIDPEKGCVLKAEMAKKNLHVKKNGSDVQGSSLPVLKPELIATPREGASALDRLAERERQREWHARMASASASESHFDVGPGAGSYQQPSEYGDAPEDRDVRNDTGLRKASWSDATYEAFHSVPSNEGAHSNFDSQDRRFSNSSDAVRSSPEHFMQGQNNTPSAAHANAAALAARQRALTGTSNFGKTLLQQLEDSDDVDFPLPDPSPGFGASAYSSGEQARRQPPPAALPTSPAVGNLGGHAYLDEDYRKLAIRSRQDQEVPQSLQSGRNVSSGYPGYQGEPYNNHQGANATTPTSATAAALGAGARRFTSPDLVSPTFTDFRQPRTQNRADDNTPISTLYVGGLPSSLPSLAGSVSATQLEDALRSVFSRCPGFRRMSFRHKSQGPMCFIEFEDTQHATRALNEIYGHTLGGLVKGGIRLAYSKNPLGVRGSGSNGPDSPTPLSPSYFASDVYAQSGYYGSPSGGQEGQTQVPTPTLPSRSAQYDQQGYPRPSNDYASPLASQQAFAFHQQQQQQQQQHSQLQQQHQQQQQYHIRGNGYQPGPDQRYGMDRRATSPSGGPGSAFAPFTLDR